MKKYYIPYNLDLDTILMQYETIIMEFEQKNNTTISKDLLAFVVAYVIDIPPNLEGYKTYNGKVNVHAGTLRDEWFRKGPNYLKLTVSLGIFDCDNHFIVGKKSTGYKLAERYRYALKPYLFTDPKIIRKLGIKTAGQSQNRSIPRSYHHLLPWFEDLEIDYDKAICYLDRVYYPQKQSAYQVYLDRKKEIIARYYKNYYQIHL